ncbi:hypothetical protein [Methylorubrum thiocyanatum]|uniref:DUF2946 domain-containing protein n=1 Tax=Methylorubrum thiocyanatum TaxID=47958 RepID=A0AA40S4T8_9HYPH|nr:hypothetical protein [Methylorubrum thiocyanatum]MBA8914621.1 hypothetical protein [Methylorubrum thiocyanatum]GJE81966.1 hypothetical protein CJNNKLLH_3323 [Methylorubrum thiocyanatum]
MSATRSLWRSLLTVFQIVTLVAFSVVDAGHAHVATQHVGHDAAGSVVHYQHPGSAQADDVAGHADPGADEAVAGPCGQCCCPASFARWDCLTVAVAWNPERTLAGIRKVTFDSVVPETLPEPPRTFA